MNNIYMPKKAKTKKEKGKTINGSNIEGKDKKEAKEKLPRVPKGPRSTRTRGSLRKQKNVVSGISTGGLNGIDNTVQGYNLPNYARNNDALLVQVLGTTLNALQGPKQPLLPDQGPTHKRVLDSI